LIKIFEDGAEAYKAGAGQDTDVFRARAYQTAANALKEVKVQLTLDNMEAELQKLSRKRNGKGPVGERTLAKIREFLSSGTVKKLEVLDQNPHAQALKDLQQVWGIGNTMALRLIGQGVRCVKDLHGKTQVGDIKLSQQIVTGVQHHEDIMQKIPRQEIREIAQEFLEQARVAGGEKVHLEICGSYRRGKACSGLLLPHLPCASMLPRAHPRCEALRRSSAALLSALLALCAL
jgi:DNA polymerase/3'-5' exonuclease PolX